MATYLTQRNGFWHYVRRVPEEYAHLDKRKFVRESLRIKVHDDPSGTQARRAADDFTRQVESYWRDLVLGRVQEAAVRYADARRRARALGLVYEPAPVLAATATLDELVQRALRLAASGKRDDKLETAAVFGGVEMQVPLLSSLFKEYEDHKKVDIRGKSPDQLRKWRNPKKRAIQNLIENIGDKRIDRITRHDALIFRSWWQDRIEDEDIHPSTANKDFNHLSAMFSTIDTRLMIGLNPIFSRISFKAREAGRRPPFDVNFIQDRLLRTGAFDDLNDEARRIIYVCIETGMRLSEVCNLTSKTIHLGSVIPYVSVASEDRVVKTPWSLRDIPLVGAALIAIKEHPDGFPRYRDKAASFSALVNKFMRNANLMPSPDHTIYGLRHSFSDRLTAARATDAEKDALMGHARGYYGDGPSLAQKAEILGRIALKPPERI